jgi:two-component system, sensor histidine kinase
LPTFGVLLHMRKKILVVDDVPVIRTGTSLILRNLGFETEEAASGSEALEKIQRTRYALIFLDYNMPTMDGCECARLIRCYEDARGTRTPIICFTSGALTQISRECLEAGMDDCLSKSCQVEELSHTVARWKGSAFA